nr:hypothetical protein CIT39_06805 [Bradyrhizobium symbiodeficiens]
MAPPADPDSRNFPIVGLMRSLPARRAGDGRRRNRESVSVSAWWLRRKLRITSRTVQTDRLGPSARGRGIFS